MASVERQQNAAETTTTRATALEARNALTSTAIMRSLYPVTRSTILCCPSCSPHEQEWSTLRLAPEDEGGTEAEAEAAEQAAVVVPIVPTSRTKDPSTIDP